MVDMLIRNGIVVTPDAIFRSDIAINGEKIAAICESGSVIYADSEYDAEGKYVLPGLIDPHVHMRHPFGDQFAADDCYTSSVSAAVGGTTTMLDFAIQWDKSQSLEDTIQRRQKEIEKDTVIDFGLHGTPTKSSPETIQAVAPAITVGVPSFKIYMIYRQQGRMVDDAILFELLKEMKRCQGLLMVHAENASVAEFNQSMYLTQGDQDPSYFPLVKPNFVEAEAIHRALFFNEVARSQLYIAHLSTAEGCDLVKAAQARGQTVFAETCPHYLVLSANAYRRIDGENFICSPPLRSSHDNDVLWEGLAEGTLAIVSSDHCGFSRSQKAQGGRDFSKTPNGLPGIETRLPLIYTQGVLQKRISLHRMVEVLSTNAAKIFGLYPQKGVILPGSDADLVIVDPALEKKLSSADLHGAVDWTPFEGMKLSGFGIATFLRGRLIVENGRLLAERGSGKYLPRSTAGRPS